MNSIGFNKFLVGSGLSIAAIMGLTTLSICCGTNLIQVAGEIHGAALRGVVATVGASNLIPLIVGSYCIYRLCKTQPEIDFPLNNMGSDNEEDESEDKARNDLINNVTEDELTDDEHRDWLLKRMFFVVDDEEMPAHQDPDEDSLSSYSLDDED